MKLPISIQSPFSQCRQTVNAGYVRKRVRRALAITQAALFSSVLLSATACSSGQTYLALQGWQRNECNKLIDLDERDRCTRQTNTSYEAYRQQIETGGKP